jgi:hypothetical protein
MIDLSRSDCPIVSILRAASGIAKQPAHKKEKKIINYPIQDASDQFITPQDTPGQRWLLWYY